MHRNGKPWSKEEDAAIRKAAKANYGWGILTHETRRRDPRPYAKANYEARLKHVADVYGRSYAAVRKRASRLRIRSYPTGDWRWI